MSIAERQIQAEEEFEKLKKWIIAEGKKRLSEFEEKGKFNELKDESDVFSELYKEFKKEWENIFDKYDLPKPIEE